MHTLSLVCEISFLLKCTVCLGTVQRFLLFTATVCYGRYPCISQTLKRIGTKEVEFSARPQGRGVFHDYMLLECYAVPMYRLVSQQCGKF